MTSDNTNFLGSLNEITGATFFKQFADTIPHIIIVVRADNFKIQYINRLQPGFTLEQVMNTEVFAFIWPEYHDRFRHMILDTAKTSKTNTLESEGASALGKAWYRTFFCALPDQNNVVKSVMLIAEDITENKLKSIELLDKGEKLKAIINNTNDIICSIDLQYTITEYNSVFENWVQLGYNTNELKGKPVLSFIDPTKHDHLISIYKRVQNGESCLDIEKFALISSGGYMYYETSYNPIRNNEGLVVGINIFSKNITDRILNEEKLRSTLKEKDILLAEIHHRIKNNLAMVSSLLHLQEMNIQNEVAKEALLQSRRRIKSTALVHELLYRKESFSKIILGEYLVELFDLLNPGKEIAINVEGDNVDLSLETAMPMGLLMNEIMMNSFKHSYQNSRSGNTKIILKKGSGTLKIFYGDSQGIFPDEVDFENAASTGLLLIQTFIQQLNGKIRLLNKAPLLYEMEIPYYDE
jgi:PAS domain S-box-containing protein